MPETVVHFQLRMPPELHEKLSTQAKNGRISLNALIVTFLDRVVGEVAAARASLPENGAGTAARPTAEVEQSSHVELGEAPIDARELTGEPV